MSRDRGAATAELVAVLPVLVAVVLGMVWLLSLGVAQVRTVDAARETARALARGDPPATAIDHGRQVGVAGTSLLIDEPAGQVRARASVRVHGPGGVLGFLPGVRLHATAVAASEDAGAAP
ncbi:TadE family type IV pilus minor pilin [Nocardioides sp. BP30]|uniref:TadE family type IV pilus minor pilin n=1 Tax=Nocardioides sp. BP30 TaxID=3036374 RepID=UPI002469792B|nr:TadE family type IV pilus minor pilin [Nocardioides sp. BP30]WGL52828.1 TadE family type IV pilus minor pilin [Nocardioides sp. BP30]